MTHKTKRIALQWNKIDIKMIPLIKAMNADPEIHTTHCCQGDPTAKMPEEEGRAYIQFYIFSSAALNRLIEVFASWTDFRIQNYGSIPRYTVRFPPSEIEYLTNRAKTYLLKDPY